MSEEKKLELSEAILLGSLLRPQVFRAIFKGGGSCAYGAALEAVGLHSLASGAAVLNVFPILSERAFCPACIEERSVVDIITHLNDAHYWTRERIATEFVAPLERKQAEAAERAPIVITPADAMLAEAVNG